MTKEDFQRLPYIRTDPSADLSALDDVPTPSRRLSHDEQFFLTHLPAIIHEACEHLSDHMSDNASDVSSQPDSHWSGSLESPVAGVRNRSVSRLLHEYIETRAAGTKKKDGHEISLYLQKDGNLRNTRYALMCPLDESTAVANRTEPTPTSEKEDEEELWGFSGLLHHVQQKCRNSEHSSFKDSKTFVDMPLKCSPAELLDRWEILKSQSKDGSPGVSFAEKDVVAFVEQNFETPGTDLVMVTELEDWKEDPPQELLDCIHDEEFKNMAKAIHGLWIKLARRTADCVKTEPGQHTLLWLPEPFIVPGGRFIEMYYWDSYWTILGLLHSNMTSTARCIIKNMLYLIDRFGFIPNGSRTYYVHRSQPPLLCEMVYKYQQVNKDDEELVLEAIPHLITEYSYWMSDEHGDHAVKFKIDGKRYVLNRFYAMTTEPRPEGYMEDIWAAQTLGLKGEHAKAFYRNIASGAETGWDFSSRWTTDRRNLAKCCTTNIIPVDLNCILAKYETNLLEMLQEYTPEDIENIEVFQQAVDKRKKAIETLLWNEEDRTWYDLELAKPDLKHQFYDSKSDEAPEWKHLKYQVASNYFPLWARCYRKPSQAKAAVKTLMSSGLVWPAGIACSTLYTKEQWDFPNGWPPIQYIIVEGLRKTGHEKEAKHVALHWLYANYLGWNRSGGKMYEKYDVRFPGNYGKGGEYEPQDGFGWTNGIALHFLTIYGDCVNHTDALQYGDKFSSSMSIPQQELFNLNTSQLITLTDAILESILQRGEATEMQAEGNDIKPILLDLCDDEDNPVKIYPTDCLIEEGEGIFITVDCDESVLPYSVFDKQANATAALDASKIGCMVSEPCISELVRFMYCSLMEGEYARVRPIPELQEGIGFIQSSDIQAVLLDSTEEFTEIEKLFTDAENQIDFMTLPEERALLKEVCKLCVARTGSLLSCIICAIVKYLHPWQQRSLTIEVPYNSIFDTNMSEQVKRCTQAMGFHDIYWKRY